MLKSAFTGVCLQMGPSGSGKTTLLNLMAGRAGQSGIQGEMLWAGQKPNIQFIRRYAAYVEQVRAFVHSTPCG